METRELIHAQQRLILRRQKVRVVAHRPGVPATYQGNRRHLGMFQGTPRILRTGTSQRVCRRRERAPLRNWLLPRHLPQLIGGIIHLILAVQNLRKRLTVRLETNHRTLKRTLHRRQRLSQQRRKALPSRTLATIGLIPERNAKLLVEQCRRRPVRPIFATLARVPLEMKISTLKTARVLGKCRLRVRVCGVYMLDQQPVGEVAQLVANVMPGTAQVTTQMLLKSGTELNDSPLLMRPVQVAQQRRDAADRLLSLVEVVEGEQQLFAVPVVANSIPGSCGGAPSLGCRVEGGVHLRG